MIQSRAPGGRYKKARLFSSVVLLLTLLSLLLSACGDPHAQQQATTSKAELDKQIANAQSIGVPASMLKPILQREKKLSQTSAPATLFSAQPATDYYANLQKRYHILAIEVQGLKDQATNQLGFQATQDMQTFEDILAQRQAQNYIEAKTFSDKLANDQKLMDKAQYPKNFVEISADAKDSTEALHLLGTANDDLTSFQNIITQLQASNVETSALTQQQQSDLQLVRKGSSAADFKSAIQQIEAHLQGTTTLSTQAIPYVGAVKIKQFSDDLDLMKQSGIDTTQYQQHLDTDKSSLANAKTLDDFLKFSSQIDNDLASIQIPMLQAQAKHLTQQFHTEVTNWGNANLWTDPYDNQQYKLDYPYDQQGIGSELDAALNSAQTPDDYQSVIDLANHDMTNLKAMEADYSDTTPWNQPHASDKQLMDYYHVNSGLVLIVSLIENTFRAYQDGQLVASFQVVSGRYELPSPPGFWHIVSREKNTVFKAFEPPGSRFWYPDTPINYASGYRSDGYFFHDSVWRSAYGGHDSLPHHDPIGDSDWTIYGSHGCMNMPLEGAAWVYNNTTIGTPVILY